MKLSLLSALSLIALTLSSAHAVVGVSLVGGLNYGGLNSASATSGGRSATVEGGLGYGGGALLELGPLETGAIYVHRTYKTIVTGRADVDSSNTAIIVPLLYRVPAGPINFGLGGFYDLGDSKDYGPSASLRLSAPLVGPFFEVRFNYGLKTGNEKDVLALIGYKFGL